MRQSIKIFTLVFVISGMVYAQTDIDFSEYTNLDAVEDEVQNVTDGIHAGMSALDWTSGSAPSLLGFSVSVFTGFGSFDASEKIGLEDGGVALGNVGAQVGIGTGGIEAYARFFPETELSDVKLKTLGFGLKYELSKLIPAPMFPAVGVYADYNTLDFGINDTRSGTLDGDIKYSTDAGIDMSLTTINVGVIVSKSLILVSFYGKLAYEIGKTDVSWNSVVLSGGTMAGYTVVEQSQEFDNNGIRYGVGMTLMGIRAEVGGRGSNLYLGLGYGISL